MYIHFIIDPSMNMKYNPLYIYIFLYVCVLFLFTVFNLSNGIDVEATKERIEAYKRENKDVIRKNRSKMVSYALNQIDFNSYIC